ncbi:MAG: TrbG/VirB9 family P-type conjugative transfer protein [Novosphingobium sp.]
MIRFALTAAAACLVAIPALAGDARLLTHRYNAEEVVRVQGQIGVQASIAFADDELIENVAIGDSASWQVTPNKRANLLFVKPLSPRARTNMTVVTDRRTYFFDLVSAGGGAPLYVLRFTYPDEPRHNAGKPGALPVMAMSAEEAQAVAAPPAEAQPDPAKLNFAWRTRGKAQLLPSRIYDDGTSTYLTWPAKALLPAMQIKDDKGVEGPVNYAVRGEVLVVEGVPDVIVLRSGKEVAELLRQTPPRAAEPAVATIAAIPAIPAPEPKAQ